MFRGFLGIPDQGFFPFCLFVIGQAPGWFPGGKNPLNTGFFMPETVRFGFKMIWAERCPTGYKGIR